MYMYVCICLFVCMYELRKWVYTCVFCEPKCACMYECMHALCTHVCIYACMYVCMMSPGMVCMYVVCTCV
jgi:hypothetical protein